MAGSILFGKPRGAVVGRDSEVGTLVSSQALVLTGVARLPGGTLRLKGKQTLNDLAFSIPVVGGTGRFARARGKCQVRPCAADSARVGPLRCL